MRRTAGALTAPGFGESSASLIHSLKKYWKYTKKFAVDLDNKVRNRSALQQLPDEFLYVDTALQPDDLNPRNTPGDYDETWTQPRRPMTAQVMRRPNTATTNMGEVIEKKSLKHMNSNFKKSQFIPKTNMTVAIYAGEPMRSLNYHQTLMAGFLESKDRKID